jgi:hypothetical protein
MPLAPALRGREDLPRFLPRELGLLGVAKGRRVDERRDVPGDLAAPHRDLQGP